MVPARFSAATTLEHSWRLAGHRRRAHVRGSRAGPGFGIGEVLLYPGDLVHAPGPPFAIVSIAVSLALLLGGCTCSKSRAPDGDSSEPASEEVSIEAATLPGAHPVALVLDPSGVLCASAVRAAAGRRHVLCDRTKEDLSAAALKRGLTRLKAERGAHVVSKNAWLVVAPDRAAVARALAMRDPAFFSRVAAWVGSSPMTAGLFGPTFLSEIGGRGFDTLVLLGPGAAQAATWVDLAARQKIRLRLVPGTAEGDDPVAWGVVAEAFASPRPEAGSPETR